MGESMQQGTRSLWDLSASMYLRAFATVAGFIGLQHLLGSLLLNHAPLALLIVAVGISAWVGGRGPGIFATVVAATLGNFFFLAPYRSFVVTHEADLVRLGAFAAEGCLVSWLAWKLRQTSKTFLAATARRASSWILESPVVMVLGTVAILVPLVAWGVFVAESDAVDASIRSYGDSLWWAIGTVFRGGYGERAPVTNLGRLLASLLMVAGFIGVATLGGKLIAMVMMRRMPLASRAGELHIAPSALSENMDDHVVVCGWRRGAERELAALVRNGVPPNRVFVVVPAISREMIGAVRRDKKLLGVTFLSGDYSLENTLAQVRVSAARSVIVFGGNEESAAAGGVSADLLAVKTAICLSQLNIKGDVRVEVWDGGLAPFLKQAGVGQITVHG